MCTRSPHFAMSYYTNFRLQNVQNSQTSRRNISNFVILASSFLLGSAWNKFKNIVPMCHILEISVYSGIRKAGKKLEKRERWLPFSYPVKMQAA